MAKRTLNEQLDGAIDAIMDNRDLTATRINPRIDALLRIAAELRDLPSAEFKARLKAELLASAQGAAEPAPAAPADERPTLAAHDVRGAADRMSGLKWRELAKFNNCQVGLFRFSGTSPWERHNGGDEFLLNLDGEVDLITLTDDGPVRSTLHAGSFFVCPRGLWHRQLASGPVTQLYATPSHTTQISRADDPRREGEAAIAEYTRRVRGEHPEMFGADYSATPAPPRDDDYRLAPAPPGTDDLRPGPSLRERLVPYDLEAAFRNLPAWTMRFLATMDQCTVGVSHYSDAPHWELHPDGDELLYIVDGEVEMTTLTEDGAVTSIVPAGSVFVCPKGLWHFPRARPHVSMLFVTPGKGTRISDADDPRSEA